MAAASFTLQEAAVVCAENIAVLHLLNPAPAPYSSNPVADHVSSQIGYTLPFEIERSLASTLAFLARVDDNPNYVPAICLKEDPEATCLNVLLAVNKTSADCGNEVLGNLKEKFGDIFALLSEVGDGLLDVEQRLYTAIISMCSMRIKIRMRFIMNYRKTKSKPIRDVIQAPLDGIQRYNSSNSKKATLLPLAQSFETQAREVVRLIDGWDGYQTSPQLESLVEGIYRLRRVGNIEALLPHILEDISWRNNLVNTVSKVARYRKAARFLHQTARKFPLSRQMRLHTVDLPRKAFDRAPTDLCYSLIQQVLTESVELRQYKGRLTQICNLLGLTTFKGDKEFAQQARKTLTEAKVHAEVQLIYYCELKLDATRLWPRVIRSSKNTCWLCNEFILTHGKMYTSGCHGKLYPGWRLPLLMQPSLYNLTNDFNRRLQTQIGESLRMLLETKEKTRYNEQNESTLSILPYGSYSSILSSEASSPTVVEDREEETKVLTSVVSQIMEDSTATKQNKGSTSTSSKEKIIADTASAEGNKGVIEKTDMDLFSVSEAPQITENSTSCPEGAEYKEIAISEVSPIHKIGPLKIQVEYAEGAGTKSPRSHSNSRLRYVIERLSEEDVLQIEANKDISIVDVESLEGELSYNNKGTDGGVYIRYDGFFARITLARSA